MSIDIFLLYFSLLTTLNSFICLCMHACMYVYVCICMYMDVYVCMCMCMYTHVYVYVGVCTCMCIHMCIYSILPITRTSKGPMKMVRVNECSSYPG